MIPLGYQEDNTQTPLGKQEESVYREKVGRKAKVKRQKAKLKSIKLQALPDIPDNFSQALSRLKGLLIERLIAEARY
jgi:hypothetical protein